MPRSMMGNLAAEPRVNLLPASEVDRRERERLAVRWGVVVIVAVLVAALLTGAAWAWNQFAQQQLMAAQDRTTVLLGEVDAMAEASHALETEAELTAFLAEAMGSDLSWVEVQRTVESVLPDGVTLVGIDLRPGAPSSTQLSDDEAESLKGLDGTITLESTNAVDIAKIARALRSVRAVVYSDPYAVAESNSTPGTYTYTLDVMFDRRLYSGRFAANDEGGDE